jgi:hypothetical protein
VDPHRQSIETWITEVIAISKANRVSVAAILATLLSQARDRSISVTYAWIHGGEPEREAMAKADLTVELLSQALAKHMES